MAMNVAMMAAVPTKIGPTWASAEALLLLLEMTTNAKRNYHVNTTSTDVMSLVNTKKKREEQKKCNGMGGFSWKRRYLLVLKASCTLFKKYSKCRI